MLVGASGCVPDVVALEASVWGSVVGKTVCHNCRHVYIRILMHIRM